MTLYSVGLVAEKLGLTVSAVRHLATKVTGLSAYEVKTPCILMQVFSLDDISKMRAMLEKRNTGESNGN